MSWGEVFKSWLSHDVCKRWTIDGFPHGGPEGTTADATFAYAFISSVLFTRTRMTPAEHGRFRRVIVTRTIVVNHSVLTNEHYKILGLHVWCISGSCGPFFEDFICWTSNENDFSYWYFWSWLFAMPWGISKKERALLFQPLVYCQDKIRFQDSLTFYPSRANWRAGHCPRTTEVQCHREETVHYHSKAPLHLPHVIPASPSSHLKKYTNVLASYSICLMSCQRLPPTEKKNLREIVKIVSGIATLACKRHPATSARGLMLLVHEALRY